MNLLVYFIILFGKFVIVVRFRLSFFSPHREMYNIELTLWTEIMNRRFVVWYQLLSSRYLYADYCVIITCNLKVPVYYIIAFRLKLVSGEFRQIFRSSCCEPIIITLWIDTMYDSAYNSTRKTPQIGREILLLKFTEWYFTA